MNDSEYKYSDPTNRVVCTFDNAQKAEKARAALIDFGFTDNQVHKLVGDAAADEVDTSAKWFADTDKEIKKYEQELRAGAVVLSVPVKDCDCREEVHSILKRHDGRHITHFGEWITEVMR